MDPREVLAQSLRDAVAGRSVDYDAAIDAVFGLFAGRRVSVPAQPSAERPHAHRAPPPPPRPREDRADERKLATARRVLGFTMSEALSPDIVNARRKRLARKFHPDITNGSGEKMAAINAAADLLVASLS